MKKDKKTAIVEAALKLFIKNGIAETKMKQVAEVAGVDQPLIHYYFREMDQLYLEVIEKVGQHLTESSAGIASAEKDPAKVMKAYLVGTLNWPRENAGYFSIWIYFYYLASFHPVFSALNKKYREEGRQRIELFIYRGLEAGVYLLTPGSSVSDIALNIQGLLTGNAIIAATEDAVDWDWISQQTLSGCFRMLGVQSIP